MGIAWTYACSAQHTCVAVVDCQCFNCAPRAPLAAAARVYVRVWLLVDVTQSCVVRHSSHDALGL